MNESQGQDPMDFFRNMWSNMGVNLPGMVTPTLDVDELDKRITDMKAVEGWLSMNLNMLKMTIQGLEMQRATIAAMKTMGQQANDASKAADPGATPFGAQALWPWSIMQQMAEASAAAQAAAANTPAGSTSQPETPKPAA